MFDTHLHGGSTIFELGGRAFLTGDTLFVDGVGRPDPADHAKEHVLDLHRWLHSKVIAQHYEEVIRINTGTTVPGDSCRRLELGPNRCAA